MITTYKPPRTKNHRTKNPRLRRPREAWRHSIRGVYFATEQEGKTFFDCQAKKELGISGETFLARWDAGAYRGVTDWETMRKVERLSMLIPFARRTPA